MGLYTEGAINRLTAAVLALAETIETHEQEPISNVHPHKNVQKRYRREFKYVMEHRDDGDD